MKIKHILLSFSLFSLGILSNAQTITSGNLISEYCPQYMSTGSSTRMATYFRASIVGLNPGEKYYYTVRAVASSDLGNSYGGVGGSLFISSDSPSRYVSNPSFTAGNFDSFTVTNPLVTRWFGFVNSGNTRFGAGKYVIPMVSIKSANPGSSFSVRLALDDSIKVLSFSTSAGSNNGRSGERGVG